MSDEEIGFSTMNAASCGPVRRGALEALHALAQLCHCAAQGKVEGLARLTSA